MTLYSTTENSNREHQENIKAKRVLLLDESGNYFNTSNPIPVEIPPCICDENSTSTPLGGNATWTGSSVATNGYGILYVSVFSDVASATNGLVIEQSIDGTNWDFNDTYSIHANTGKTFSIQPAGRYIRVKYTNGVTTQNAFRLQTVMKASGLDSSHRVQDTLKDDDDGRLRLSVLKLRTAQDTYVSGSATTSGNFKVSLEEYNGNIKTQGLPVRTSFNANDIDEASSTITYIGMENEDGTWYIKRINTLSGTAFAHATETNNNSYTTYSDAWSNRLTLTYGDYSEAF
jgi:hypothetical protein